MGIEAAGAVEKVGGAWGARVAEAEVGPVVGQLVEERFAHRSRYNPCHADNLLRKIAFRHRHTPSKAYAHSSVHLPGDAGGNYGGGAEGRQNWRRRRRRWRWRRKLRRR